MKKILIFASLLFFVFASQLWAIDAGHPWEGDREEFVFTVPSVVMGMITPFLNPDGWCPDNCEVVYGWRFINGEWVPFRDCLCHHLK